MKNYFPWDTVPNLLWMKLTTDLFLLFLSAVNNDIFVYFLCYRCRLWNQLNQRILDRVACTTKVNIAERFMGNDGFLQMFIWWMDSSQSKTYYLTNLVFSEGRTDFCYCVPTLANSRTYSKQSWCYKVMQSIMTWYMNLLTLSYPLQYVR